MTTAQFQLGRYVVVRANKNGTHRVQFVVPDRLRPATWPKIIRLPELGIQTGSLLDSGFRSRIVADAERLNQRLDIRRRQAEAQNSDKQDLPKLLEIHYCRPSFQRLSKGRMSKNRKSGSMIFDWSAARGHPDVESLSEMDVDDFLSTFKTTNAKQVDLKSMWSSLFKTAIYAGWIKVSPLARGGWTREDCAKVRIWTQAEVDLYAAHATRTDQAALGVMIQTLFITGQRIGDMRTARWGHEYNGERFVIRQSKTKKLVNVLIPAQLRDLLRSIKAPGSPYVFTNHKTNTGFTAPEISVRFTQVRSELSVSGDEILVLKALRHSCVHQMFSAGATTNEIAAVTGHLLARVYTILDRYSPDREGSAEKGIKKRHVANGGSLSDFAASDTPVEDWVGAEDKRRLYDAKDGVIVALTASQFEDLKRSTNVNWANILVAGARRHRVEDVRMNRAIASKASPATTNSQKAHSKESCDA